MAAVLKDFQVGGTGPMRLDLGFRATVLKLFGWRQTTNAHNTHIIHSVGYHTATQSWTVWAQGTNNASIGGVGSSVSAGVYVPNGSGSQAVGGTVRLTEDGAIIDFTTVSGSWTFSVLAFRCTAFYADSGPVVGVDITGTGSKTRTGYGFQPTYIETAATYAHLAISTGTGVVATQGTASTSSLSGGTTGRQNMYMTARAWGLTQGNSGLAIEATLTALGVDGLTLNVVYVNLGWGGLRLRTFAFRTTNVTVSNTASPGATGNQSVTTTGYTPEVANLVGCNSTAPATYVSGMQHVYGVGARGFIPGVTTPVARSAFQRAETGTEGVAKRHSVRDDALYYAFTSAPAQDAKASLSALASGSLTINWSDIPASGTDFSVSALRGTAANRVVRPGRDRPARTAARVGAGR